jgi:hypothetical protein
VVSLILIVSIQIFGLQHTLNNLDAHDIAIARARLSGRLIYMNGLANIPGLYAALLERAESVLQEHLECILGSGTDWAPVKLAPLMRVLTTRLMSLIFVVENLCMP